MRPLSGNVIGGRVWGVAYFGKDSLYRIVLPSGFLISVHAVNAQRGDEGVRVADWDDEVWVTFDASSAIILTE